MSREDGSGAPPVGLGAALHERLLEAIGEGLFVLDAGARLLYFNAAAERLTETARAAVLGRTLWEAFPSLVGSSVETLARDALRERTPLAARSVGLAREPGGALAGLFDARSYPLDDGGVLVLFAEVSARERQRRELADRSAENERLRELARAMAAESDSTRLLGALCDTALTLCCADGAAVTRVLGAEGVVVAAAGTLPPEPGRRFVLAGTSTARLLAAYREMGRGALVQTPAHASGADAPGDPPAGADVPGGDVAIDTPWPATGRPVGAALLAPLAAHDQLLGVLAVARSEGAPPFAAPDAERLRVVADHAALALWKAQLVEEARTASETKSAFLASVSHELRTPLTALTGYGELLADEILGPLTAEQHDVMERMRAVTHQLTSMIEEILTFSSLEAGRELVRPVRTDVADVVRQVLAVIEPLAAQKGLALQVDLPADLPAIRTDPDKLRQILVNLAGNAVKFTERGRVGLVVAASDGWVRFAVTDTGVGIAAGDLPRLFQAFSQLDTGLTRRHGGTGLGLHIAQRLAQLLGGRVTVRSTSGVGSVFCLEMPGGGDGGRG